MWTLLSCSRTQVTTLEVCPLFTWRPLTVSKVATATWRGIGQGIYIMALAGIWSRKWLNYNDHSSGLSQLSVQRNLEENSIHLNALNPIMLFGHYYTNISVPICQNQSSSHLVKNEWRVFSESLRTPPSSAKTIMAITGLQRPQKYNFVNAFLLHFHQLQFIKHVPISETHRIWWE